MVATIEFVENGGSSTMGRTTVCFFGLATEGDEPDDERELPLARSCDVVAPAGASVGLCKMQQRTTTSC